MQEVQDSAVASINELTAEVIARTISALRTKLPDQELAALTRLVAAGTFLDAGALLGAIQREQEKETT